MDDDLKRLLSLPKCECGSKDFDYRGFGEFKCRHCGNIVFDSYGKVYNYVETHPNSSITEVADATGVSEVEIADLVTNNRIVAIGDPRLNICCKKCGSPILLGDYCEKCRIERQNSLDRRVRKLMYGEDERKKSLKGSYVGTTSAQGKLRFKRIT